MNERIRSVDANLLPFLHALVEERNLTHAGARMAMSQPAMSGALGRLRTHFDDELLIRDGREFRLSPLAEQLRPVISEALVAAEALLGSHSTFDPATSTRRFTLTMSEYAMTVLAEPVARAIRTAAPSCTVSIDSMPRSPEALETHLMRRDLMVSPVGFNFPGQVQPVFTDHLVCVVDAANDRVVDGALTMDDLTTMPNVVAEFAAAGPQKRPLEVAFERAGVQQRNISVVVMSLLTLPFAVAGTPMYAFVPSRLALRCRDRLGLRIVDTELPQVRITEAAHWHPRRNDEPAIKWLRELLYDVAVELEDAVDG